MAGIDEEARRLRLAYQAWRGLALLEDFDGQVARLCGCAEAEAMGAWLAQLARLVEAYAARYAMPLPQAVVDLEDSDTQGQASGLPWLVGHRWKVGES
jgi:hypothetical protein